MGIVWQAKRTLSLWKSRKTDQVDIDKTNPIDFIGSVSRAEAVSFLKSLEKLFKKKSTTGLQSKAGNRR